MTFVVWGTVDFVAGGDGGPFRVALIWGTFGGLFVGPMALGIGVPLWLLADGSGVARPRNGAIAGFFAGLVLALIVPWVSVVLPFAGALAGYLAVRWTNRLLPKTWR